MVVNPADVPTKDKERADKTDRVDCRKLARGLRNGEIKGIYVPSKSESGRSQPGAHPSEHGEETDAVQEPDHIDLIFLRHRDS